MDPYWQESVIQSARFAMITIGNDGVITSFNTAAENMLKYKSEEIVGKHTPMKFHLQQEVLDLAYKFGMKTEGVDILELHKEFTKVSLAKGPVTGEFVWVRKDGLRISVRLSCSKLTGAHGETIGYLGIAEELSDVKQVKTELDQIYGAIDRSAIVVVTDKAGKIIEVNQNFCLISGYSREELLGQDHRIINSGYHSKDFFKNLWSTISKGNVWQGEIKNKKKNGDYYWVQAVISPLYDANNNLDRYIAIRFDITERKNAENNLIQSAKMATLGEMAGNMAHEINNPLSIILGRSRMLQRNLTQNKDFKPEEIIEGLEKIDKTCHRISKIVRGLRNFARNSENDPFEEVRVSKFIEDALELCSEKIKNNGIDLQLKLESDATLECRLSQLLQVMINLISNAFDAIYEQEMRWIRIEVNIDADQLIVAIIDSGGGVSKEIADRILEPFFTTKPVGKGTGLGLSISKGIVESHGGVLYLDTSSANTKFVFEIPLKQSV